MKRDDPEPVLTRMAARQLTLLLLAPLLLWPAFVNGGAFFFPDTSSYIRTIDALAVRVLNRPSDWTSSRTLRVAAPSTRPAPAAATAVTAAGPFQPMGPPVLAGRSPFYGALTYLGVLAGSFWVVIAIQALAAMMVIIGVVRHAVSPARHTAFAAAVAGAVAVTMVTPLPFYAAMLTPDAFAGLAIVAAATLLVGWRRETRIGRIGWMALIAFGALTHSATMLILLAIVTVAALFRLLRHPNVPARAAIAGIVAAALVGLAGEMASSAVVERMTGHPPVRPPFITARLTADGVGTDYLREHCGTERWVLCRFLDRLPSPSDSFLWSPYAWDGVFMTIPASDARALSREQMPFVLAVLRDRPGEVIQSSAAAILEQARQVGLSEFHYTPEEYGGFVERMPPNLAAQLRETGAFRRTIPLGLVVALAWPLVIASMAAFIWAYRQPDLRRHAMLGAWVLFGWAINIAVCGALSTPHDRYNMRVIWMLPLIATVIAAAALARPRRHTTINALPAGA